MASKGSRKELSVRQESVVAAHYRGRRSSSSGGAITDEGDVRVITASLLFECKGKFGELTGQTPVRSSLLKQFEKVADEAYAIGYQPAMALRFYAPGSFLADSHGFVDLAVHLLEDDAFRMDDD